MYIITIDTNVNYTFITQYVLRGEKGSYGDRGSVHIYLSIVYTLGNNKGHSPRLFSFPAKVWAKLKSIGVSLELSGIISIQLVKQVCFKALKKRSLLCFQVNSVKADYAKVSVISTVIFYSYVITASSKIIWMVVYPNNIPESVTHKGIYFSKIGVFSFCYFNNHW